MKVTDYLINILKELPSTFTYKGETYRESYYGGSGENSYVYWSSSDSGKEIRMDYRMEKIKDNHYSGVDYIKHITFWEDYDEGLVYDEWKM